MPSTLLFFIFSFLLYSEHKRTKLVCKVWQTIWKLPMASQLRKFKSIGHLIDYWPLSFSTHGITVNDNRFIVGGRFQSNKITIFSLEGKQLCQFDCCSNPGAIGCDTNGHIYVTSFSDSIHVYTQNGNFVKHWDCTRPFALSFSNNEIFVASSSGIISVWTLNGQLVRQWNATTDKNPYIHIFAIAVDWDEVFVTDWPNHQVQVFSKKGVFLRRWGTNGSNKNQFIHPSGIAVNEDVVYVIDSYNKRIQMFERNGTYRSQWYLDNPSEIDPCHLVVVGDRVYATDFRKGGVQVFEID